MIQTYSYHIEMIGLSMVLIGVIIFTCLSILALETNEFALLFFKNVPVILILVIVGEIISVLGALITPIEIDIKPLKKSEDNT